MALTAKDVIDECREELNDISEEYRFKDKEMLRALTAANRQLAKDRPDLLLTATGTRNSVSAITDLSDELIFDEDMLLPLAHYTSQVILTKDSEDDLNMKLAGFHLNKYNSII